MIGKPEISVNLEMMAWKDSLLSSVRSSWMIVMPNETVVVARENDNTELRNE